MTYTPGPWRSDEEITGWLGGEAPGVAVWAAQLGRPGMFAPVCMVQPHLSGKYGAAGSSHPLEDARLISAAPDLLIALEALLDSYVKFCASGDGGSSDYEKDDEIILARVAIRKAREAP